MGQPPEFKPEKQPENQPQYWPGKRTKTVDLPPSETAVDNLSRVNLLLSSSGCAALSSYCGATFEALVRHMTAALEERVEANLAALNYPRCVLHEEEGVTLRDEGERVKFENNFCLLIALARTVRASSSSDAAFLEPSEILLRPLRKRFRFHFWGQKKTNNLVRPESQSAVQSKVRTKSQSNNRLIK